MAKYDATELDTPTAHRTLTRPTVYLWRMLIFLVLIGFLAATLYQQAFNAFMANPGLNGLIIGTLAIGILYAFRQVVRLFPEIRWVNGFRIADPGIALEHRPALLAPMANMLGERRGQLSLPTVTMRTIMDSIGSRLDEARDTSRYLIGLLIFLGLLGTFWGLLQTIGSIGKTISALDTSGADSLVVFEELKAGLAAPLKGMGTAFSSSLFGLAGSLVLGFLDLQAGQAQNRFYNELEEWLAAITEVGSATAPALTSQVRFALVDMQRAIVDLGEKMQTGRSDKGTDEAIKELAKGIEKLVRQMRAEQKVVREWVDEQAAQQSELAAVLREISGNARARR